MSYATTYQQALTQPALFWQQQAQRLPWFKAPTQGVDTGTWPTGRWFSDGEMNTCYMALDHHVANGRGDQVAIYYDSPVTGLKSSHTYTQLLHQVALFAGALRQQGVAKGDRVVIYMPMVMEAAIAMLACARIGAVHSVVFGGFAAAELAVRIDDAKPTAVISASCGIEVAKVIAYKPLLDEALQLAQHQVQSVVILQRPQLKASLQAGRDHDWLQLMAQAQPAAAVTVKATDPLYILYTSGTTGKPKGVIMTHGGMAAKSLISMAEWQWPQEIRYLASSPISHAAGFLLIPTFLNGGKVYLTAGFDPDQVLDLVEKERVNTLFLVPTMIYVLMDHPRCGSADLSSIESIIYASAPMSPTRLEEALQLFGPVMLQCYGQTECIHLTMMRKEEHRTDKPGRLASCGRPPAGVHMALLNEQGQPVAPGEVGEVCIRSAAVMGGYWKRPEATAEALAGGWLHTGDLARQDEEGFYYLVDRAKDMIISGGFNIYPREVEDVLTAHPGVALAAVIGIPDEKWGEKVIAVVVPRKGTIVEPGELIELVKTRKGAIQAPKQIDLVDALPQTALGKTDKKALRQRYWGDRERMVN